MLEMSGKFSKSEISKIMYFFLFMSGHGYTVHKSHNIIIYYIMRVYYETMQWRHNFKLMS